MLSQSQSSMIRRLLRKMYAYEARHIEVPSYLSVGAISERSGVPLELVWLFDDSFRKDTRDGRRRKRIY